MKKIYFTGHIYPILLLIMFSIVSGIARAQTGTSMSTAFSVSISCGGSTFYDFRSTSYGFTNTYGQPSADVWYTFTLTSATKVDVSTCGSNFDTYLHVLDEYGDKLYDDDDGGCANNTSKLSGDFAPGTYYVVAEGYYNYTGNLYIGITAGAENDFPGGNITGAFNAGTFGSAGGSYSDIKNNSSRCYGDDIGQPNNDIYYQFKLSSTLLVKLSHCGSNMDTYMHLLNYRGSEILFNDDEWENPSACENGTEASIETILGPGTYYVASEGYGYATGNIVTNITATPVPVTVTYPPSPQILTVGTAIAPIIPTITNAPAFDRQMTNTYAGSGSQGSTDGDATAAMFNWPLGVVSDGAGNLYVSDSRNHRVRKVTPAGIVSTLAGVGYAGYANGSGTGASFNNPNGLAIDASGNIYVADEANNAVRKVTPAGVVTTFAGNGTAGFADGTGTAARFNGPAGICIDALGNIYVGDSKNNRIRKISSSGVVSTYAGSGSVGSSNGPAALASFKDPRGMVFDASGNLIVCDRQNYLIRKISSAGTVSTLAGSGVQGWVDGSASTARFGGAHGISIDESGNLYVVDQGGNTMIRKITPAGVVSTFAGANTTGSTDGSGSVVRFNNPYGICSAPGGIFYIADTYNNKIRKMLIGPFSITPTLPSGLVFNYTNGIISGTPLTSSPATVYTISGYNVSAIITISVQGRCLSLSQDRNYVVSYSPREEMSSDGTVLANSCDPYKVQTGIQYFDGLGRPLQTVKVKGNNDATKDLVQPLEYDQFGREAKKYLPYASSNADGSYKIDALSVNGTYNQSAQYQFYQQTAAGYKNTVFPYSQTVFEPNPLNRVTEQGAPGADWQPVVNQNIGHTSKAEYKSNNNDVNYATTGFAVRIYSSIPSTVTGEEYNRVLSGTAYYNANRLYLTITKDENWTSGDGKSGTTEEYKDIEGRIVLKRTFNYKNSALETLSTYYVYDDFGNLSFVLPPGANPDNPAIPSQTILDNYCYQYRYDDRRRLIEKKIPGKGWEYLVYNNIDQVVLSQDANQRVNSQWLYSKYDALDRPVISGIYTNTTVVTRPDMQTLVDNETNLAVNNPINPIYEKRTSTGQGYSDDAFPRNTSSYLTVNYYDDYDFPGNTFGSQNTSQSNITQNHLTGTKVNVLGSSTMLLTVIYYDNKGNPIQSKSHNHLNGTDVMDYTYNFTGQLLNSLRTHTLNSTITTIAKNYAYDHMGRIKETAESINGATPTVISKDTYNQIGQLLENKQHSEDGVTFLNTTSYTYNERGWLKSIGNSSADFNEVLKYNDGSSAQYNGNISQQLWGTSLSSPANNFNYSYDKLNRLTSGISAGVTMSEVLDYDVMGNINQLNRDGVLMDYNYTGTGNQLNKINNGTAYQYDANGNNTLDGRAGNTFTYNYLNLPATATTATAQLSYTYDATGQKLKNYNATTGITMDYVNGIVYRDNGTVIDFILTDNGLARNSSGAYAYEYNLKDHLGNIRYSFKSLNGQLDRLQADDYYAFGLRKSVVPISLQNKYLYNGKELQEGLGQYDYGARFYDPVIGRWNVVDPLGELTYNLNGYHYTNNNPVNYIDPDGRYATWLGALGGWVGNGFRGSIQKAGVGSPQDVNFGRYFIGGETKNRTGKRGFGNNLDEVIVSTWVKRGPQLDNANSGGETDWYGPGGKINWSIGSSAASIESFSGIARVGSDFSLRTATASGRVFYGNQFVKTISLSKLGGLAGKFSFGLGVVMDINGVRTYYKDPASPNAVHPGKAALNTGVGAFGLTGVGTIPSILYFGIDAFYPGGVSGYAKDYSKVYQDNPTYYPQFGF